MGKPSQRLRTISRLGLGCLFLSGGCGLVPQAQLDECRQRAQTLQADNSRLKDQTLSLRAQNDDLTARAVADARRLRLQDESLERLETSVQAYQDEREQLASAVDRLKGLAQSSVSPLSSRVSARLRDFAENRPGCVLDSQAGVLTIATSELFAAKSDRLKPGARALLDAYAALLAEPEASALRLTVVGPSDDPSVRRVSVEPEAALSRARANRVRDWLVHDAHLEGSRVQVADPGASAAKAHRIEFRMRPRVPSPSP